MGASGASGDSGSPNQDTRALSSSKIASRRSSEQDEAATNSVPISEAICKVKALERWIMSTNLVVASFVIAAIFSSLMFILRCRSMYSMRDFTKFTSGDHVELILIWRVGAASELAGRTPRVGSKIAVRDVHRLEKT